MNGYPKPAFRKVERFVEFYPHQLESNEWLVKWPLRVKGVLTTYNPDFYCPATDEYIEVTTSKNNMWCQGDKWQEAINQGYKLKVFWWEGQDITDNLDPSRIDDKQGGRPKKV